MKFPIQFLFLCCASWNFGANITLIQKSTYQYHLLGNVSFGIDEVAVDLDRPTYIVPGKNFIVSTGKTETWVFGTDQIKIDRKKVSAGPTDWVKIGDRFVVLKLKEGMFLYTFNEDGEIIGTKISPEAKSRPSRLIFLESMVLHEWSTKGAFLTFLDRNQITTREVHDQRLRGVFYYHDAPGIMETSGKEIVPDLSDNRIGSDQLGSVLYPTNLKKTRKKIQLRPKKVNLDL